MKRKPHWQRSCTGIYIFRIFHKFSGSIWLLLAFTCRPAYVILCIPSSIRSRKIKRTVAYWFVCVNVPHMVFLDVASVITLLYVLQVFVWCVGQEPDSDGAKSWPACRDTSFNFRDSHLGWPEWWFCFRVSLFWPVYVRVRQYSDIHYIFFTSDGSFTLAVDIKKGKTQTSALPHEYTAA